MVASIILGSLCGKVLYSNYKNTNTNSVFAQKEKVYALQEGVYTSLSSLNRNTKDINPKTIVKKDNEYYVYVGITRDLERLKKLKKVYNKKGYTTYQKEINVDDAIFLANLDQYDLLLDSAKTSDDVLAIQEVVLSNYEELVKS